MQVIGSAKLSDVGRTKKDCQKYTTIILKNQKLIVVLTLLY